MSINFQKSLNIHKKLGTLNDLWPAQSGLASIKAKLNRSESAIKYYKQALDTIEHLRGDITEKEQKLSFIRGKLYVYDEFIDLLQDLHNQYPNNGYDRKTLEIFERKQGRIFLEEMGKSGVRLFANIPEAIPQREIDLNNQLEQTHKQLAAERQKPITEQKKELIRTLEKREETLLSEQETLQQHILKEYPDYYALKYPEPAALAELQQKVLQSGELLLIYSVVKAQTILWVVSQNQFRLIPINISEADLQNKIEAFRILPESIKDAIDSRNEIAALRLADDTLDDLAQQGYALYQQLFPEAVRSLLAKNQVLFIVPTGPLYGLPFEALVTEVPETDEQPHYLIEDFPITYLSSASLLKILRDAQLWRKQTQQYPLLAFANPVYSEGHLVTKSNVDHTNQTFLASLDADQELRSYSYLTLLGGTTFAPLPETEKQAKAIAELLNAPTESNPLQLREQASKRTVFRFNREQRLGDYQYIMFAAHGILPGEVTYIMQPAIVLSHPEQDGYLMMADAFGLQMNAKLVLLSACNTGRGEEVKGEGIMGLTRAFMYAGTPAVTVTLWSVNSAASYEINTRFFRHLKEGKPLATALRQAKLDLLAAAEEDEDMEHFRHPFFWAPFVVFGDGR